MATELDYMEYANDAAAQSAYVSNDYTWDLLDEDCVAIDDWTDGDKGAGVSEVDPAGQFRFDTNLGAAGDDFAYRYRDDLASPPDKFIIEIRTYFDAIGALADTDYARLDYSTATWLFRARFCSDGLFISKTGGASTEVGTNIVAITTWQTWRFEVDKSGGEAAATVEVFLDDVSQGTVDCDYEVGGTDGRIAYGQFGYTTNNMVSHVDYIKLVTGVVVAPHLQCYSEDTIKQQGDYSLKGIAKITDSLNDTLTRTVDPTIDLSNLGAIHYNIRPSRSGSNIKIGIHDSGGTTTEHTPALSGSAAGTAHTITFEGTAQLDTAEKKWGTASLLLDGNSDYLTIPNSVDWDISTNFTIDFFVKHVDHAGDEYYISQYEDANNSWGFRHDHDEGLTFFLFSVGGYIVFLQGGEITDTAWHHAAVCKVGNEYGLYLDGTQTAHTSDADIDTYTGSLFIGEYGGGGDYYLNGHMDEKRIQHSNVFGAAPVVGLTDTIDVPTEAHTPDADTVLLLHLDGADEAQATVDSSRDSWWQPQTWDITVVANANKDAIDSIIITILNTDADNTFYIDNMYALEAAVGFMLGCNFQENKWLYEITH